MRPAGIVLAGLTFVVLAARWSRLSKRTRVIGAGLAVTFAIYGSGAVHVPDLETAARDIGATLGPYTYLLVGLLAYLETASGLGLVAPGELAVIVGGVSAGQGQIGIELLIAIVWACAFAGDVTSFVVGRSLGRGFLVKHGGALRLTPDRVAQVEKFVVRHGGKTMLVGRFIGLVRALAPFIAGASGMRPRQFIPYAFLAAGIWATAFSVLGYVFWQSFDQAVAIAKQGTIALVAVLAVIGALITVYRFLRVAENRVRARAWLRARARRPVPRKRSQRQSEFRSVDVQRDQVASTRAVRDTGLTP